MFVKVKDPSAFKTEEIPFPDILLRKVEIVIFSALSIVKVVWLPLEFSIIKSWVPEIPIFPSFVDAVTGVEVATCIKVLLETAVFPVGDNPKIELISKNASSLIYKGESVSVERPIISPPEIVNLPVSLS